MKRLIILLVVLTTGIGSFAQKSKGNSPQSKGDTVREMYTCPMHPDVVSAKSGKCPTCNRELMLSKKEQMKMEIMKLYTCPMHPDVTSDKPGDCTKCGMHLVAKKADKTEKKKGKKKGNGACCR